MTDPAFDSQFFQEIYEPLHRSGGFDTHAHRAWKRGIKLPHVVAFVLESHLHYLSRCGVQHRQRLLASVQITSYNSHLGLLRSEHCRVNTEQSTRAVARPAPLWHQSIRSLRHCEGRGFGWKGFSTAIPRFGLMWLLEAGPLTRA